MSSSAVPVNINQVIDRSKLNGFQMMTFVLCSLCLMLDGFDAQAMGYVGPVLIPLWKIPSSSWGQIASATPLGVMFGSLLFSVLADKIGRRRVLIGVTFYYAVLTLATGMANSPEQLLWIRLIAGFGLGGIMPNTVALSGEYSPARSRVTVMMVVANSFSAGAALGGFAAAWLIAHFGWRSVFFFGGTTPLLITLAMLVWLPESLQYCTLHGKIAELRKWLGKLDPAQAAAAGEGAQFVVKEKKQKGVPWVHLFYDGRTMGTLFIWAINFMNLLNLYFLSNWLPTVMRSAGFSTQTSVLIGATLQLAGTVGAFALGWAVHRIGFVPVLATGFLVACVNVALIGQPGLTVLPMFIVVALAGWGIVGGQAGVNAMSATFYPTDLRSTGVGAGLGMGRMGAIIGPWVAGQLLSLHWSSQQLFLAAAVPALLSSVFMLGMRFVIRPGQTQPTGDPVMAH
ncbi:MAG TPA: MFS transporter [Bryobacteraceae bacterium]|nr:MFS transporter [Bryobacteraceae bacterium]